MKRFAFLMLLAFAIVGCQIQEDYSSESFPEKMEDVNESDKIPVAEMLSNLDGLLKEIDDVNTRFGGRRVKDIAVLGSSLIPSTRSQDAPPMDSLLYLINFEDYEGFALMAADKRMGSPVYAITESGELLLDEVEVLLNADEQTLCDENGVTNGALFAKELILNYAIRDFNEEKDAESAEPQTRVKPIAGIEMWTDTVQRKIVPTIVKTKWGQRYPFNKDVTGRVPVGCAPVAVAQIVLAERRVPNIQYYNSVECCLDTLETIFYYEDMKSHLDHIGLVQLGAEDTIANLQPLSKKRYGTYNARNQCGAFVGSVSVLCNIGLDDSSSGAPIQWASNAFQYLSDAYAGISVVSGLGSEALRERIVGMLQENRPVYMRGADENSIGHAWVVDGYVQVIRQDVTRTTYYDFTEDVDIDETILKHLLHMNWGWHGDADGYYLSDVLDTSQRETFDGTYDNIHMSNAERMYNFDYEFAILEY